jgi:hypothetical protein
VQCAPPSLNPSRQAGSLSISRIGGVCNAYRSQGGETARPLRLSLLLRACRVRDLPLNHDLDPAGNLPQRDRGRRPPTTPTLWRRRNRVGTSIC